jgi:hypothetical protein
VNVLESLFLYLSGRVGRGGRLLDGVSGMRLAVRSLLAGGAMALCTATAAAAGMIQVVSAGAEFRAAHPRPAARGAGGDDFRSTMDQVFGPGRWRQTSGYRSPAEEDALRRQGAGTVAPGHVSRHSIGGPGSPGAYDVVVDSMAPETAAAKLRRAGGGFSRVVAEAAHGGEGPHLHIELATAKARGAAAGSSD